MQATEIIDLVGIYRPHRQQYRFHASKARFRAFIGGVGSGKTTAGAFEILRLCMEHPGIMGIVAAPSFPMLQRMVLPKLRELIEAANIPAEIPWSAREARFFNGSILYFAYAQKPETLRGPNLGFFWLDEAALCPEEAFLILQGRLREKPGLGWITTTPKGRNWVYDRFIAQSGDSYAAVRCRTQDNPHLPPWFIEELRRSYSGEWAAQELDAEFVEFGGLIYKMFKPEVHVFKGDPKAKREDARRIVAGVDWGYTSPGAIVVIVEDQEGDWWVVEEVYQRGVTVTGEGGWAQIALELRDRFGIVEWLCDPSEPDHIQEFRRAGLNAIAANNAVIPGIQRVAAALEQRKLKVHEHCVNLLEEFRQYHWELDSDGKPKMNEKPAKGNDHALDALRYGVMGIAEPVTAIDDSIVVSGGVQPDVW
ncbi:MAG: phage terminase large subunit [Armatimonadetes bacterium]|nr:phage terminase large subunit [Armatimonadota bacterium]